MKKFKTNLTVYRLREVLKYNSTTGVFRWRSSYNNRVTGKVAGTIHRNGYRYIRIDKQKYFAHRLAWLYVYGVWPPSAIDHRDTIKSNNRISNLRLATQSQNNANKYKSKKNSCGFKGVHFRSNRWMARIGYRGKQIWIGGFDSLREARIAYFAKAKELFGEFARTDGIEK